jgi:hypothetical protein
VGHVLSVFPTPRHNYSDWRFVQVGYLTMKFEVTAYNHDPGTDWNMVDENGYIVGSFYILSEVNWGQQAFVTIRRQVAHIGNYHSLRVL